MLRILGKNLGKGLKRKSIIADAAPERKNMKVVSQVILLVSASDVPVTEKVSRASMVIEVVWIMFDELIPINILSTGKACVGCKCIGCKNPNGTSSNEIHSIIKNGNSSTTSPTTTTNIGDMALI